MTTPHEDAARALADRFWEDILRLEPLVATEIGDERFDDRLPDPSDEGVAEKADLARNALEALARIDRRALDFELQATLDIIETGAQRELEHYRCRIDRFAAVTHLFGPGNLLAELGSLQRADTPERLDRYVARLSAIPSYLEAVNEVARAGADSGHTQPALVVDRAVAQVERLLASDPETSPGMTPAKGGGDEGRSRVGQILRELVWPAYGRYLQMLKDYRARTRESIGLCALSDGEGMYASLLESFTTLPLKPQEVHDTGLRELDRIQEERQEVARRLGHPSVESAIAEYNASDKNTAHSREEMLRLVEDQVRRSWEVAAVWFGRLPRANCEVRPVEEFREADMPGAFYMSANADGSRPGIYYVNTGGFEERPLHHAATTSFHEANPGHHFQLSIEREFEDRHPIRRFGSWLVGDAFVEGWGLYSERLADEMGLFLSDYERLGMLEADGFRCGRLIVDTGIHALGWNRERAVRQMIETGSSRLDAEIEVDRYISWPGQACAYKIGQLEIMRWRRESAERENGAFSLSGFHDRLLALGSLPMPTLEREVASTGR
jgi:uncharacterized protein (DUF885 family)